MSSDSLHCIFDLDDEAISHGRERFGTARSVFTASKAGLERVPKIGGKRAAEIERLVTAAYEGEQTHLEDEESAPDESL